MLCSYLYNIEVEDTWFTKNHFYVNITSQVALIPDILFYMLIQQVAVDKNLNNDKVASGEDVIKVPAVDVVTSELNDLNIATNSSAAIAPSNSGEHLGSQDPVPDIDKKIRALRKKVNTSCMQHLLLTSSF